MKKNFILLFCILLQLGTTVASTNPYSKLYWLNNVENIIRRSNLDGTVPGTIISSASGVSDPGPLAIAVDAVNGKIYWSENGSYHYHIKRANLDGSNPEDFVDAFGSVHAICIDNINNKIYWSDYMENRIRRCNLNVASEPETVIGSAGHPDGMALDQYNGVIYWFSRDEYTIKKVKTDGSNSGTVITFSGYSSLPPDKFISLYYNYATGKLYWNDYINNMIKTVNADGTGSADVIIADACKYTGLGPIALTMDMLNQKIYWAEDGDYTIKRANLDGSVVEELLIESNQTIFNIAIPAPVKVSFGNGSGFTQTITPAANQAIGRFKLTANPGGVVLTNAVIKLNNERSGLSNFKLWSSTDESFGSDTQVGTTIAADPGMGKNLTFSSLNSAISSGGTYLFLTADVDAGATGTVQAVLADNNSLTITGGLILEMISNDALSNGDATLPVELTAFTACKTGNGARLDWTTATEFNNNKFEVERQTAASGVSAASQWMKIGEVPGSGSSNSVKHYSFTDTKASFGRFIYRLKQLDNNGQYEYSSEVMVDMGLPAEFAVKQNYPNPFNPSTTISYQLPEAAMVSLKVFDIAGREVASLVNQRQEAGIYTAVFDAGKLAGGIYIARLNAGKISKNIKMALIK